MRNKFVLLALAMVTIVLSLGCVTDDSKTTVSPFTTDIATLKAQVTQIITDVANLKEKMAQKADSSRVDALVAGGAGAANSYTKAETYTQQQVNDAIATAIAGIKSNQSWIIHTTTTPTNPTPGTIGTVSVLTTPTNVQILGNAQLCYTAKITNTSSQWAYVRPIITINAGTGQSPTVVNSVTVTIGGSIGNLATANFQFTPTLPSATTVSSITCIPTTGGNGTGELQIAAGSTMDVLICIQIDAANPIIWNIGTSVNSRTL